MVIDSSRAAIRREAHRLARGTRDEKRQLLRVGYETEFQNRLPALINGKLATIRPEILSEVVS
jgi:hypothetical protein